MAQAAAPQQHQTIETDIPQRLDRLPWSSWHRVVVLALGITWLLDGLEVTLAGSLGPVLRDPRTLGLTDAQVGGGATGYLAGAVIGALVFGHLTDRLGRKKLFFLTLILYLAATAATAFSWNFFSFFIFRALTGAGIGGEYAAINSAVDELIPASVRGNVDLVINSTFWIGAALGSAGSVFLLDSSSIPLHLGWRFAFGIGAVLGLVILFFRRSVPESPRWLILRGRVEEANRIVNDIEAAVQKSTGKTLPQPDGSLCLETRDHTPFSEIWHSMANENRTRSFLGFSLMVGQSFFYNAVFFTYALALTNFYGISNVTVPWYILPLALGNFVGPLILGRFFDSIGRKPMIIGTYAISGIGLAITAWLFAHNMLTATTQAVCFTVIFFIASSAASAAYLTVSEIFPLEIRALAIAVFYAIGTLVGGVGAPWLFGELIQTGSKTLLAWGYLVGAVLMCFAAVTEAIWGVAAERQSLESISKPLSSRPAPAKAAVRATTRAV
jgi:MFS family permease